MRSSPWRSSSTATPATTCPPPSKAKAERKPREKKPQEAARGPRPRSRSPGQEKFLAAIKASKKGLTLKDLEAHFELGQSAVARATRLLEVEGRIRRLPTGGRGNGLRCEAT